MLGPTPGNIHTLPASPLFTSTDKCFYQLFFLPTLEFWYNKQHHSEDLTAVEGTSGQDVAAAVSGVLTTTTAGPRSCADHRHISRQCPLSAATARCSRPSPVLVSGRGGNEQRDNFHTFIVGKLPWNVNLVTKTNTAFMGNELPVRPDTNQQCV